MKKNKLFPVLLSLGLAFGVGGVTALSFPTGASAEVKDMGSDTLYEKDGIENVKFNVTGGYGHLKVYVKNTGDSNLTVNLKHKGTSKIYIEGKELKPGEELEWNSNNNYSQGVRAGEYDLQLHSGKKTLEAYYAYKSSDIKW
ncbi:MULTISPECIES: hypothetical protein [Bacillus]|uniref:hypothetical protein n=1 Tax=Bacillus TaxID=1386 RepID=UPI001F0C2E6D|nr:hypothetical protein [Bacillus sp. ES1-5]MDA1636028.1 hypothetical protein [Bacillus cereus]